MAPRFFDPNAIHPNAIRRQPRRQPMLGNAQNRTTSVMSVHPTAAQQTTNVTGAQTAQTAQAAGPAFSMGPEHYSDPSTWSRGPDFSGVYGRSFDQMMANPEYSNYMHQQARSVAEQNAQAANDRVRAGGGLGQDFEIPESPLGKTLGFIGGQIGQQMDAREASQQAYGNAYANGGDPAILAESYRKQAIDNYRQTPGGESFIKRFTRNPNLMISPMASKQMQMQQEQDAIDPNQVIGDQYEKYGTFNRIERTGEEVRDTGAGYQVRRRPDGGGNTTPFRTRAEYALTGDAATQDQIDAFEARKAEAIEARGGVTGIHHRRIQQKQDTLNRAVRRGIISEAEADRRIAGMVDDAGGDVKNYLSPDSDYLESKQKQQKTDAAGAAGAAGGGGSGTLPPRLPNGQFPREGRAMAKMDMEDTMKDRASVDALDVLGLMQPNADGIPSVNVTSFSDFTKFDTKVMGEIQALPPEEQYTYAKAMAVAMRAALADDAKAFEDTATTAAQRAIIDKAGSLDLNDQEQVNEWFSLIPALKEAENKAAEKARKERLKAYSDLDQSPF